MKQLIKNNLFKIAIFLLCLLNVNHSYGQVDSAKRNVGGLPNIIKPYKDVVPANAKIMSSFFQVDVVKDRYLLELPDSMLKRDILVVTRVEKGPINYLVPLLGLGYGGDEFGRSVIAFEKISGDRLVLKTLKLNHLFTDTTANSLSRADQASAGQTVAAIFAIKAVNKDKQASVIDITDFVNSNNLVSTFIQPFVTQFLTAQAMDKSFIDRIDAYPDNIEIKTVKTFPRAAGPITFEFNNSLILLPKVPMKPRLADLRVGFFFNSYQDFDSDPIAIREQRFIDRWRLEPKDEAAYLRGELVEPKKPIIIYIDPATPKKWVPYLIQGINDWQVAFEKAGFKNAIFGKEAPVGDSTWSVNDSRHSVLVYKPSPMENASGPNVNDPRSGEILETHINWYHQVLTLIHDWYTIQAGAVDPRTHQAELPDSLMGQLIRFVSSHEVGHTIGLQHNFGASSTVSVELLRNKKWVEAHGHTPSIMDYARFNYVAQPGDGITDKGMFPRIGDYDKWAVEWGYKWLPQFKSAIDEKPFLNKWVVQKLASGKQYFYGSQLNPLTNSGSFNDLDPRDQSEDLGDDAVLASLYGIKNMKRIEPHFIEWFSKAGEDNHAASEMYKALLWEFNEFMMHVSRNIGGVYITPKTREQTGPEFIPVDKAKAKKAMGFLQIQLFNTPSWLIDNKLYLLSDVSFNNVQKIQYGILKNLFDKCPQLVLNEEQFPGKSLYSAPEMLADLRTGIFSEIKDHRPITMYRRNLQDEYVNDLAAAYVKESKHATEVQALLLAEIQTLRAEIKNGIRQSNDLETKNHLSALFHYLDNLLNNRNAPLQGPGVGLAAAM